MTAARFVVTEANGRETECAASVPAGTDPRTFAEDFLGDAPDAKGATMRVWIDVVLCVPIEELGPPHAEVTR